MKQKRLAPRKSSLIISGILLGLAGWLIVSTIHHREEVDNPSKEKTQLPSGGIHTETAPVPAPRNPLIRLGYYTGDEDSFAAVQNAAASLTIVSADVYAVQFDGSISGDDTLGVVEWDKARGIETFACISNYNNDPSVNDFDAQLAHAAIVTQRDALIDDLLALAREGGYSGINIDFENLAYSSNIEEDRAAFTLFIHDLAGRLHAESFRLIVSVPGKNNDSIENTWAYPFDLAALGADADYLQLMTYDQHGPWGEPGAVSGADWVEECLRYTTTLVDPQKLLIGLPAYGYDWDLSASDAGNGEYSATDISWQDFDTVSAKPGAKTGWDADSQTPFITYTENGHAHIAWIENAESLRAKLGLMKKYDLAGLSMWALGKEDASFWQAAEAGL